MVKVCEIHNYIKILADETLAENWDNVGLILGDENQDVNKILICLDVTNDVVDEAILKNVNLIISHHPLIFKGLKKINYSDFKGKIIQKLIKNDISVISAHTNIDSAELGLNNYLAKLLNFQNIEVLFKNNYNEFSGLGRIGTLEKEYTIDEFITYIKNKLDINFVKLIKGNTNFIKKVAILGGSGGNYFYNIPDVDVYLTGDVTYHIAQDAIEMKKNIIDIGHFAEKCVKYLIKEYLEQLEMASNFEIILSSVERDPFEIR